MVVYSYYYGASAGSGIGVQAQSKELERLPLSAQLKELSSLHALESSEHSGEMLSYKLQNDGYTILGLTYIESSKSSGYGRSAPCGLQYVIPDESMRETDAELGKIINFVNFQKPDTALPAPLKAIPLNDSGYYYHNSTNILAPLVDGLLRVALSSQKEVLLIALPKGKNSEYATARYTIAEALCYVPTNLRRNIRFFTGLPVPEGISDPTAGYDKAVSFDANVIFCPNEYYSHLKSYRSCIGLDMDRPSSAQVGAFANYIVHVPDISTGLSNVANCLQGIVTYDSLNNAAQKARRGESITIEKVQEKLQKSEANCIELTQKNKEQQNKLFALQTKNNQLLQEIRSLQDNSDRRGPLFWILLVAVIVVLMGLSGFGTWIVTNYINTGSLFPKKQAEELIVVPTQTPTARPTDAKMEEENPETEAQNAEELTGDTVPKETTEPEEAASTETEVPTNSATGEPKQTSAAESQMPAPTKTPKTEATSAAESETPAPTATPKTEVTSTAEADAPTHDENTETEQKPTDVPSDASTLGQTVDSNPGTQSGYKKGHINAASVNIREKPSLQNSEQIDMLAKGTALTILDTVPTEGEGEWYKVRVDETEIEGFVLGKFVEIDKE